MSPTPPLSNGMIGRTQHRISTMLHLDRKDSEFIHHELELFTMDLMKEWEGMLRDQKEYIQYHDKGDEA